MSIKGSSTFFIKTQACQQDNEWRNTQLLYDKKKVAKVSVNQD
jgi:hypothetical protein